MGEKGVATTSGWISASACRNARCLRTAQQPVRITSSVFTIARSTRALILSTGKKSDRLLQRKRGGNLLSLTDDIGITGTWDALGNSRQFHHRVFGWEVADF